MGASYTSITHMEKKERKILIAIVVVILLVLVWAWDTCRLGKYSRSKVCGADAFCGAAPDPGALSEAAGLYELGVRASEGFTGGASCGSTASPAAMAEYQGLMQLGWRPEHMKTRPSCAPSSPAAISEAQSLQQAGALSPGAPYYNKAEGFAGAPTCSGRVSPEAAGEAHLLNHLQAGTVYYDDEGENEGAVDGFAAHKLTRDRAAFASTTSRSEHLRSNPAQVSSRQARFSSMREGFGGPEEAGFGWSPNAADFSASPSTGGWGDAQSTNASQCMDECMDGCGGTNCRDHCKDRCRSAGLLAAAGNGMY